MHCSISVRVHIDLPSLAIYWTTLYHHCQYPMTSTRTSAFDTTVEGTETQQSPSKEAIGSYLVTLDPEDNAQCMSTLKRWVVVFVISSTFLCHLCILCSSYHGFLSSLSHQ